MEQAVNQFNKGLQMDTNPMLQGNNSLTDCLNGTLVTMNGNEIILQNDMGNRKIDQAYLPSGYEPVGIKEYGGVIYLALYNPITNRSQIGSFPSPDQRVLNDITYKNNFDLKNLSKTFKKNTLYFLENDTMLIPLTSSNLIRVGDKFSIYIDDDEFWSTYVEDNGVQLSNYHNTFGEKIVSPKNKLYTLSIGILNSKNEFVDITPTLQKWYYDDDGKKEELLSFSNEISQNYINNAGYFIKRFAPSTEIQTEDDENLLKERQKLALNTYSYKLVGPLYLKAKLNHPTDFSYNITGSKVTQETATGLVTKLQLTIDGTLTYNCPDGVDSSNINDPVYQSLGEGYNPEINGFDLYLGKTASASDISQYQREVNVDDISPEKVVPSHDSTAPTIGPIVSNVPSQSRSTENTQATQEYIVKDSDLIKHITNVVYAYDLTEPISKTVSKVTYDGENYKVRVRKSYEITLDSEDETKHFYIAVPCKLVPAQNESRIYINDLFSQFSINFSLLEEDRITLTDWRYTLDTANEGDNAGKEVININMTLQSYLKGNELINRVNFNFTDWRTISIIAPVLTSVSIDDFSSFNNTDTEAYILRTYNISTQLLLKSESEDNPYEFIKRVLYNVSMNCALYDSDKVVDVYDQNGKVDGIAWLLTTKLFNNVNANFLNTENIKDLLKITPTGNVVLSKNSSSPKLISSTGKFVSPTLDDLSISYTYEEIDEFTATCNIETFTDKSLYPQYLDVLNNNDQIDYTYEFNASQNGVQKVDEDSQNTLSITTKFTDTIEASKNESKVTVNNTLSPFDSTDVQENGPIHMGFVLYDKKLFLVCSTQVSLDFNIVTKSALIKNATTVNLVQNLPNNDFNFSSINTVVYKIGEAAVDFYVFRILSYTDIISAILKRILQNNSSIKCNWFNIMFYDLKPSPTYPDINFYDVVWRDPNFPLLDSQVENYVEKSCESCESIKNATTFVFWKYNTGSEEGFRLLDLVEVEEFPQPGIRRTNYEIQQDYSMLDNYEKYNKNYKVIYEHFGNLVLGNADNDYYLCQNDSRELYKLSSNSIIKKKTTTIQVSCSVMVEYVSDILSMQDNAPIKFEVTNESFSTTFPQYVIEKNYDDILNLDISNLLISEEGFTTDSNGDLFVANSLYLKKNGKYVKMNLPDITIKDEFPIFNSNQLIAFKNTILKESYNANQCYFVVGPWIPYFKTSDL